MLRLSSLLQNFIQKRKNQSSAEGHTLPDPAHVGLRLSSSDKLERCSRLEIRVHGVWWDSHFTKKSFTISSFYFLCHSLVTYPEPVKHLRCFFFFRKKLCLKDKLLKNLVATESQWENNIKILKSRNKWSFYILFPQRQFMDIIRNITCKKWMKAEVEQKILQGAGTLLISRAIQNNEQF